MTRVRRSIAALAVAVVFLLPLAFLLLGSLRRPGLPPASGFEWIPNPLSWQNYATIFGIVPMRSAIVNSLVVTAVAVPVTVVIASLAGFAIVRATVRVRTFLIVASIVALMVPVTALWVPRFVMYRWMGLIDTPWVLMLPALMATTPFFVLIFALAYSRIPRQLFEAAVLEGARPLRVWRRVALPLARPATFAVAVLAFTWHWSNFVDPLLFITSDERVTVPLALHALASLEATNHPLLLAGAAVAVIPPLIAFLVAQNSLFRRTLDV
ncbi:MAG: carbohydrate ABC transporter permease [Actinomycetota bacterium]|nr:carbohydrate ABC transporter permease [Actinomycetota bacterium]